MDEVPRNITVSREALRADLLQLELRLTEKFTALIDAKASASLVDQLEKRLTQTEQSLLLSAAEVKSARERVERNESTRKWIFAQGVALLASIASIIYVFVEVQRLHHL